MRAIREPLSAAVAAGLVGMAGVGTVEACAVCFGIGAESSAQHSIGKAFNLGILTLLAPAYLLAGGLALFIWRTIKTEERNLYPHLKAEESVESLKAEESVESLKARGIC